MCAAKWPNSLWTVDDLRQFVTTGYDTAPCTNKRDRISDGLMLNIDYILNDVTQRHYTDAMELYIAARKLLEEQTGYRHELKSTNPAFGKKNFFKKSQMQTLLTYVIVPLSLVATTLTTIFLVLLLSCCCKLLCPKKSSTASDEKPEEAKKRD